MLQIRNRSRVSHRTKRRPAEGHNTHQNQLSIHSNQKPKQKIICGKLLIAWLLTSEPTKKIRLQPNYAQGLRASAKPNLGVLSRALVSNSPEMVRTDLGLTSCCRRAPSFPELLSRDFTVVWESTAYAPPTVKVFSLVENLLVISATAALFCFSSRWYT